MTLKKFAILMASLFIMAALVFPVSQVLALPKFVVIGWFNFLHRVVPQMGIDWFGLITALGCLLLLGVILHWLGSWVATWPGETKIEWRWTKAPVMLVGITALFWAGLSGVGLLRSTQWLLQMDEPYFVYPSGLNGTQSTNCLKQIGLGMHNHNDSFKTMPSGTLFDRRGQALHGWQTALMPFVEQQNLYAEIRLDLSWNHAVNRPHFRHPVQIYEDPYYGGHFKGEFPVTHFAGNVYVLGARALRIPRDFPDGTSNTILSGEAAGAFPPWGQPGNWRDPGLGINRGPNSFGHPFADGTIFALADGSVRFVSAKISLQTLKALATPAGGEKIDDSEW